MSRDDAESEIMIQNEIMRQKEQACAYWDLALTSSGRVKLLHKLELKHSLWQLEFKMLPDIVQRKLVVELNRG